MKIAFINKVFSLGSGGGERYAVNLARSFCRRGHEVHLFCLRAEQIPTEAAEAEHLNEDMPLKILMKTEKSS